MLLTLVVGFLFMFGGAISLKFPIREINHFYGYSTGNSIKS